MRTCRARRQPRSRGCRHIDGHRMSARGVRARRGNVVASQENRMLQQSRITMMLPVKDLQRARQFYEDRMGFEAGELREDGKFVYATGGSLIALFPKEGGTRAD